MGLFDLKSIAQYKEKPPISLGFMQESLAQRVESIEK